MQQLVDIIRSIKGGDCIHRCNLLTIRTYHHSQAVVQEVIVLHLPLTITTVIGTLIILNGGHIIIIEEIALNTKVHQFVLITVMLAVVAEARNIRVSIIPVGKKDIIPMLMEEQTVEITNQIDLIK